VSHVGQGLFGRPMHPDEIERLLGASDATAA
jgi:hypothetical protein